MAFKTVWIFLGGLVGWLVEILRPTFPLFVVAMAFICYDAWTAFQLDKRAKAKYPDRTSRHEAKFTSFAFGNVVRKTIPERLIVILLAWMAETFVFVHVSIPLSYIATGIILFEQAWSAMENNSSCRSEEESRFWRMLQRIMVDKTARHFDTEFPELVTDEQIERARKIIEEHDKKKGEKL